MFAIFNSLYAADRHEYKQAVGFLWACLLMLISRHKSRDTLLPTEAIRLAGIHTSEQYDVMHVHVFSYSMGVFHPFTSVTFQHF
jgi:hypothetical protein